MPFFSIILPTYNRAHFLPKAIESLLAQTFEDWELVIVDDGSTDNTKEVVEAYKDLRIVYIYQKNQERSAARNNGIKQSKGDYICFLDSDDYFLPEKLSNFKNALESCVNGNSILYDGLLFERHGKRSPAKIPLINAHDTIHEFLVQNSIFSQQICCSRSICLKYPFNSTLRIGEDVELWLRMANEVEFIPVDSYQTVIVEHEDRSVNLKKYNVASEQLKQLDLIYSQYANDQISLKVRRKMKSNCLFNISKYFMFHKSYFNALYWVVKSILMDLRNDQLKHRIFTLYKLITGRIPREYQL